VQKRTALVLFGGLTLILITVLLVDLLVETDAERIEALLEACCDAAVKEDQDRLMKHIAQRYDYTEHTRETLRERGEAVFAAYTISEVDLNGVEIHVDRPLADVTCRTRIQAGPEGGELVGPVTLEWKLELRLIDGEWLLTAIDSSWNGRRLLGRGRGAGF